MKVKGTTNSISKRSARHTALTICNICVSLLKCTVFWFG